jgi:hypothetical protein
MFVIQFCKVNPSGKRKLVVHIMGTSYGMNGDLVNVRIRDDNRGSVLFATDR